MFEFEVESFCSKLIAYWFCYLFQIKVKRECETIFCFEFDILYWNVIFTSSKRGKRRNKHHTMFERAPSLLSLPPPLRHVRMPLLSQLALPILTPEILESLHSIGVRTGREILFIAFVVVFQLQFLLKYSILSKEESEKTCSCWYWYKTDHFSWRVVISFCENSIPTRCSFWSRGNYSSVLWNEGIYTQFLFRN
jgi:hypothetical protein